LELVGVQEPSQLELVEVQEPRQLELVGVQERRQFELDPERVPDITRTERVFEKKPEKCSSEL
jgi:hypothetical protein